MSGRNNRIVRNRERSRLNWDSNRVKMLAGIVFIILIVFVAVFVWKKSQKNKSGEFILSAEENVLYEYFVLSSKDNVGVIDKKGNKIIDAKYTRIDIPNPAKDVFVCYEDDNQYEILNKKGENLFTDYEQVGAIPTSNEETEMEKNVLIYKSNNRYGLLDLEGNLLTEAIYDEISSLKDKPGNLRIKRDNKYGILDTKGNVIIEVNYDGISADRLFFGRRFVYENRLYCFE